MLTYADILLVEVAPEIILLVHTQRLPCHCGSLDEEEEVLLC